MKTVKAFYTGAAIFCAALMGSVEVRSVAECMSVILFAAAFLGTAIFINFNCKE